MTTLTNLLDELLESLAWHGEPVESLQKGLSLPDIEKLTSQLPFYLPQEVYELYQWQNGSTSESRSMVNFRPYYRLMPLQETVEYTLRIRAIRADFPKANEKYPSIIFGALHEVDCLFPLLALEDRCFYSVQGSLSLQKSGPSLIYDDVLDSVPVPIATSLGGFFKSLLHCWDMGVYAVNPSPQPDRGIYDNFLINEQEEKAIFAKNGSNFSS